MLIIDIPTDAQGYVLWMQKMSIKDVYKLKEDEMVLVHVNEFDQPIKDAGGLFTRFMTFLFCIL